MPRNRESMREAAAVAVVLFGPAGRTVDSYAPAPALLAQAGGGRYGRRGWEPVQGPYLRWARSVDRRSKTGVVGVSVSRERATGRLYVRVRLGRSCRRFNIATLGRAEAFRRALALRREHLEKIMQARAAILAARDQQGGAS